MTTATQTVKERPILFSGESVRAILEGRKTQTRRIIKPQPRIIEQEGQQFVTVLNTGDGHWVCPYGKPGDRLWVRETFAPRLLPDADPQIYHYRANPWYENDEAGIWWTSPIFMPRTASRITLEVVSVRVERVQDITVEDIIAEGFSSKLRGHDAVCDLQEQIEIAWEKINGKKHPWASNPWLWVVEFKKI